MFLSGAAYAPSSPSVFLTARQIFERLQQRKDPQVLEEQQQAVNERMQTILQKAQSRLSELV